MKEHERFVVDGGVELYDQGLARALDKLREAFGFIAVTVQQTGNVETVCLMPKPETKEQAEWMRGVVRVIRKIADTLDEAIEEIEEQL